MTNIQQSLEMETNLSLLDNTSGNGLINNLKASKNTITDLNLVQHGDSVLLPGRRIHLRHHTGNQAATGSQIETGIRGKHHHGLDNNFSFSVQRCHFACRKLILLAIDGVCRQHTYRAPHFLVHSCCTDLFLLIERVYGHTLTPMHLHGSSHEAHRLRYAQKHSHFIFIAQKRTPCRTRHHARELFPHLSQNQSSSELNNLAKINADNRVAALYRL